MSELEEGKLSVETKAGNLATSLFEDPLATEDNTLSVMEDNTAR